MYEEMKMNDEILQELWEIKDLIAKMAGYDIDRLAGYYREKQSSASPASGTRREKRERNTGDTPALLETSRSPHQT